MSQKIKLTKVKANFRTGSARDFYYQTLAAHDGKQVSTFIKNVAVVRCQSRLSWFVRNGYVEITE